MAKRVGADYCIDDKLGNAVYISYESPATRSYLLERPYNNIPANMVGGGVVRVPCDIVECNEFKQQGTLSIWELTQLCLDVDLKAETKHVGFKG